MSQIRNEVEFKKQRREEQKIEQLKKAGKTKDEIEKELNEHKSKQPVKKEVVLCKTIVDDQKRKLDRLMSNPTKEVYIPQPRKERKPRDPAEFVRHVMGSSAGAGSGEFHVYRNIRKREFKRQEYLEKKSMKEQLDDEFQSRVEEKKEKEEEATNKKRAKRQRRKQKKSASNKAKNNTDKVEDGDSDEDNEESEDEDKESKSTEAEPHFIIGGK